MNNQVAMIKGRSMEESTTVKILIVDDDVASCRTLQLHLQSDGYLVETALGVDEGLAIAASFYPVLVILDIRMPGKSGLDGLPEFTAKFPDVHVIMITAFHDMDSTIQAMQRGAEDYIHKPIDIDELDKAVTRILASSNEDVVEAGATIVKSERKTMIGRSRAMKEVFKSIGLVAASPVTVLITGESGTGKELVARAIHRASKTPDGPFVAINCGALVENLLESDMFGHEKGSFTGAINRQLGKFALADKGTIFLDEISELSLPMQAKLLRVLQEKEFTPLGSKQTLKTKARVITATNVNLTQRVDEGLFREDLFYRLRVVTILLPPLRERKEDIIDLVQSLLARVNQEIHGHVTQVSKDVLTCMENYSWPGNVRELENLLAKAVALCPGNTITRDLVSDICEQEQSAHSHAKRPMTEWSLEEIEQAHVNQVLDATNWHRGHACEILNISRPRLRRMIKQFNLVAPEGAHTDDHGGDDKNTDTYEQ